MFEHFHFLRPLVLLLIPVTVALVWIWMRLKLASSHWQSIIPTHLHQRLISSAGKQQSRQSFILLMFAFAIACIAAAGPAWEKLPQPVYQTNSGRVVVMDMSLSMRATDISPSRLARAKFKAIDLIKEINDGEVGLVAYAGEAFMISPLTEDISNLENLIPSLSPEIMPTDGSNPVSGLEQAAALLENAGYQNGHIYWITDGISLPDVKPVRDFISASQYQFSTLIVGTEDAAPIQLLDGSLLKDERGAIVIPRVNFTFLEQALAPSNAQQNKMTIDSSDIQSMLLSSSRIDAVLDKESQESTGDDWRDMGVYIVLLILPIALLFFRKGFLFCVLAFCLLPLTPNIAFAQAANSQSQASYPTEQAPTNENRFLAGAKSLFLNSNQKGQQAFEAQQYEQAEQAFDDTKWRAAAAYKAGNYENALALYQQSEGLESIYNIGNTYAQMGELQKAIDSYEKVLQLAPDFAEAQRNKEVLEELLEQQQNQEQNQQQNDQNNEQNSEQDSDNQQQRDQQQDSEQGQPQDTNPSDQNQDPSQESEQQDQNQQEQERQENQEPSEQSGQQQNQNNEGPEQDQLSPPDQEQQQSEGTEGENSEQEMQPVQAIDQSELTPEEREQMQRLQTLMNKVPDDPAYLLQRKMLIESQRRKQYGPPTNNQQEW